MKIGRGLDMDIHDHYKRMCMGHITSWVARPKQRLTTVANTIATIARRNSISVPEMSEMVREVQELSVATFGSERQVRFQQMTDALRQRGVL